MPGLSDLMQDDRALEIYRYFKKSFIYLKNPPKKPNKKTIPDFSMFPELEVVEDRDPISSASKKKLSNFLCSYLTEKLFSKYQHLVFSLYIKLQEFLPQEVLSFMFDEYVVSTLREDFSLPNSHKLKKLMFALPKEKISVLYDQPFILSSLHTNLTLLLHRKGDLDSFLNHPFNQKLLTLFTELDSNPQHLTLHEFARMTNISRAGVVDLDSIIPRSAKQILAREVNALNAAGESQLHVVCKKIDIKEVESLLSKGADCNIADKEGYLPIHRALAKKFTPIVRVLEKHSDPEKLIQGKSLLAIAYENGDIQLTNYLLNQKIGLSSVFMGTTILHEFCTNNNAEFVRKILSIDPKAGYIDLPDDQGLTPLKIACTRHNFEIIRVLIMYGADVNAKINGHTALHWVCDKGHYKLAKFLLAQGADPTELDDLGNSCRMLAESRGQRKICELIAAAEAESATLLLEEDNASMLSSSSSLSSLVGTPSSTPMPNPSEPEPIDLSGTAPLEEAVEF